MSTIFFQDTFTRASGALITSSAPTVGTNWVSITNNFIENGADQVYGNTNGSCVVYATPASTTLDMSVQTDLIFQASIGTAQNLAVAVRSDTLNDNCYYGGYIGGDGGFSIYARVASVNTKIGTFAFVPAVSTTYTIILTAQGSTISLAYNTNGGSFTTVISVTDTTVPSNYYAGMNSYPNGAGSTTCILADNYIATEGITAGAATSYTLTDGINTVLEGQTTTLTMALSPAGGSLTSSLVVTPAASIAGTFNPTSLTFASLGGSQTFTFTPSATGTFQISATHTGGNTGMTDPAPLTLISYAGVVSGPDPSLSTFYPIETYLFSGNYTNGTDSTNNDAMVVYDPDYNIYRAFHCTPAGTPSIYYSTACDIDGPWTDSIALPGVATTNYQRPSVLVNENGVPVKYNGNYWLFFQGHNTSGVGFGGPIGALISSSLNGPWSLWSTSIIPTPASGPDDGGYVGFNVFYDTPSNTFYCYAESYGTVADPTYGNVLRNVYYTGTSPTAWTRVGFMTVSGGTDISGGISTTVAAWNYGAAAHFCIRKNPTPTGTGSPPSDQYIGLLCGANAKGSTLGEESGVHAHGWWIASSMAGPWTERSGNPSILPSASSMFNINLWRAGIVQEGTRWYDIVNVGGIGPENTVYFSTSSTIYNHALVPFIDTFIRANGEVGNGWAGNSAFSIVSDLLTFTGDGTSNDEYILQPAQSLGSQGKYISATFSAVSTTGYTAGLVVNQSLNETTIGSSGSQSYILLSPNYPVTQGEGLGTSHNMALVIKSNNITTVLGFLAPAYTTGDSLKLELWTYGYAPISVRARITDVTTSTVVWDTGFVKLKASTLFQFGSAGIHGNARTGTGTLFTISQFITQQFTNPNQPNSYSHKPIDGGFIR